MAELVSMHHGLEHSLHSVMLSMCMPVGQGHIHCKNNHTGLYLISMHYIGTVKPIKTNENTVKWPNEIITITWFHNNNNELLLSPQHISLGGDLLCNPGTLLRRREDAPERRWGFHRRCRYLNKHRYSILTILYSTSSFALSVQG